MRTFTLQLRKVLAALFYAELTLLAHLATHSAAHAMTSDTNASYHPPKNLARWHMGATLILVKEDQLQRIPVSEVGYFEESIFLSDNSALTYKIEAGAHDYIIDLGQFIQISRFFLNNHNAAGSFQLFTSDTIAPPNSQHWRKLNEPIEFQKGVIPSVTFSDIKTQYILVRFQIDAPGTIGNFGVTSSNRATQAN